MKKLYLFIIMLITLSILFACNSEKNTNDITTTGRDGILTSKNVSLTGFRISNDDNYNYNTMNLRASSLMNSSSISNNSLVKLNNILTDRYYLLGDEIRLELVLDDPNDVIHQILMVQISGKKYRSGEDTDGDGRIDFDAASIRRSNGIVTVDIVLTYNDIDKIFNIEDVLIVEDDKITYRPMFNLLSTSVQLRTLEGRGTEHEPYLIHDTETFILLNNLSAYKRTIYVKLENDIDFQNKLYYPFVLKNIHLEGNNKTISNVNIGNNSDNLLYGVGLFSNIENSEVVNLNLNNIKIDIDRVTHSRDKDGTNFSISFPLNIGILGGLSENSSFRNININNSSIEINLDENSINDKYETIFQVYQGGLIGSSIYQRDEIYYSQEINDIYGENINVDIDVNISVTNGYIISGGISAIGLNGKNLKASNNVEIEIEKHGGVKIGGIIGTNFYTFIEHKNYWRVEYTYSVNLVNVESNNNFIININRDEVLEIPYPEELEEFFDEFTKIIIGKNIGLVDSEEISVKIENGTYNGTVIYNNEEFSRFIDNDY